MYIYSNQIQAHYHLLRRAIFKENNINLCLRANKWIFWGSKQIRVQKIVYEHSFNNTYVCKMFLCARF